MQVFHHLFSPYSQSLTTKRKNSLIYPYLCLINSLIIEDFIRTATVMYILIHSYIRTYTLLYIEGKMIHLYMNRLIRYVLHTVTPYYLTSTPTLYYLTSTPTGCTTTIYPTGVFGDPTRVFGDHPRAIFEETKVVNIIKYPQSNF